jgi:GNAT superfamily N-acetyltransferase
MSETASIEYKLNVPVPASAVAELFRRAELNRPYDDLRRMAAMLANANHILTAWDGPRLVGVARALTDGAYCCYLSDLAVDPDYQGRGVGRELVLRTKQSVGNRVTVYLFSVPGALDFYREIGMEQLDNGFRLQRLE